MTTTLTKVTTGSTSVTLDIVGVGFTWENVKFAYATWQDVKNANPTWQDVKVLHV